MINLSLSCLPWKDGDVVSNTSLLFGLTILRYLFHCVMADSAKSRELTTQARKHNKEIYITDIHHISSSGRVLGLVAVLLNNKNGSDLVRLPLLSIIHKVLTGILLRLL